jgi:LuxR family maltose regulon positive regulatory protein
MNATWQILATQLYLPPPATTLVARPRLLDRLHAVLLRPLTTVIAPAGFGKTTLVSTWAAGIAADKAASVAWLTLDPYDDDPARFWTSVVAALQTIDPTLGREVLPALSKITSPPPAGEYLLTPLINQLAEHATLPIVLVLEDYQVINAPAIHAGLTFIVDHLPPHVHLILISRSDPPLPLARLRVRGQLTELRAADLRFTPEEAATFLNDVMGLQLTPDTIAALETHTEGWIAGLHLAALSMQHHTDRAGFVRTLSGSHHYILDYLVEEVLQRQPAPIRTFLLQTAILDRLCTSLCDAVTGSTDSVTALEAVERANLFLIPLDDERHWYRYHHLFVEMLRARLAQEQPTHIPEFHRRASAWYAQHAAGDTAVQGEAIRHALAASDAERAAQLIGEMAEALWARTELTTLRTWLTSLPTAVLHAHPQHAIMLAKVELANGSYGSIPPLLDAATAALARTTLSAEEQATLRGEAAVVRSHVACIAEHFEEAIALAEEALALLPASARFWRALATLGLTLVHHMQGALPVADARYRDAIAVCEAVGDRFLEITARCLHGRLLRERGALMEAEAAFQHGLQRATLGTQHLPIAGWALIGLGNAAYARNDLRQAKTC